MNKILALLVIAVCWASTAGAQTAHVCDQTFPPSGATTEGAATMNFCVTPKDVAGNAVKVVSEALYVDGSRFSVTGTPQGIPSTVSGKQDYSLGVMLTKGDHVYQVAAISDTGVEGEKSLPFSLHVDPRIGPAVAPVIRGVKQP
jgi:hypothetical protein